LALLVASKLLLPPVGLGLASAVGLWLASPLGLASLGLASRLGLAPRLAALVTPLTAIHLGKRRRHRLFVDERGGFRVADARQS
jgi:hypothetical protein